MDSPSESNLPTLRCAYCKRLGHVIADCWRLRKKNYLHSAFVGKQSKVPEISLVSGETKIDDKFKPFVTDGFVSVCNCAIIPIKILQPTHFS